VELSAIVLDVTDGTEDSLFKIGTWGAGTEYANNIVATGGEVGINTATPSANLHVYDDAAGTAAYIEKSYGYTAANLSEFSVSAFTIRPRSSDIYLKTSGSSNDIRFQAINNANDAAKDILLNPFGGDVGIGTSSPNIYSQSDATSVLSVQATGTNQGGLIDIAGTGTGWSGISLGNESIRRAGVYSLNGSHLAFYTNAGNSGTSLTERMRITSGGNINLGTGSLTQTAYQLRVDADTDDGVYVSAGSSSSNHAFYVENAAGSTALFTVRGDGIAAIGGSNPGDRQLYITGSAAILELESTTANNNASVWFKSNVSGTSADRWELGTNISQTSSFELYNRATSASAFHVSSSNNATFTGTISHKGLDIADGTGAQIDTREIFDLNLDFVADTWIDTGIYSNSGSYQLGASGTYLMQIYSNDHSPGEPYWYGMYWSAIISWYKGTGNQAASYPITLQRAGHSDNSRVLEAQITNTTSSGSPANNLRLELKTTANASGTDISIRFRRLL
jgi:hypothetical protein